MTVATRSGRPQNIKKERVITKPKPLAKVRVLTNAQRWTELITLVTACFEKLRDLPLLEIAHRSGLSITTIYNLKREKYGLNIRFNTLQRLAATANLQVMLRTYLNRITLS